MDFHYLQELVGISPITFLSHVLVLLLAILYYQVKNKDLPPGPTGIPILGYWPFLKDEGIHLHLTELSKKYGDVYSFNCAGKLFIHLGSIKSIKEAHLTKTDCFSARYTDYSLMTELFGKGLLAAAYRNPKAITPDIYIREGRKLYDVEGHKAFPLRVFQHRLVSINGEEWKVLRKFFVQSFRQYGLTSVKEYMSGPIYDSVNAAVDVLKATNGSPVNIISIMNGSSSAILRRILFNDIEITDEELKGILECYQNMLPIFTGKKLLLMGNIARYFIFPRIEGFSYCLENHEKMLHYLKMLVRRHENTYNEDDVRDLIDSYFKERNERRNKGDPSAELFSEDALVSSLAQIVGDGILGITIFIAYYIHELLEHPDEQERIYEELENIIGPDRHVTLEDRNKLSYTNAFIQEVTRATDFFTIFPGLLCTKETTLNGYRIPKGAITLVNFWAAHHDPKVFEEPEEFKPSRYVTEAEKPKTEAPIAFGVGKRSCVGESFTMMQVFLFLTTIIKNFRLVRPEGNEKKLFLDGIMEVCAYPRKEISARD